MKEEKKRSEREEEIMNSTEINHACTSQDAPCDERTVRDFICGILLRQYATAVDLSVLVLSAREAAEKLAKIEQWSCGTLAAIRELLDDIETEIYQEV